MSTQKKPPHLIDILMGARIRKLRTERGMSQEQLGKALGVTFQQVQKYERGANRISSSRLFQTAQALRITTSALFHDIENEVGKPVLNETHAPTTLELRAARDFAGLDRDYQMAVHRIIKVLKGTN